MLTWACFSITGGSLMASQIQPTLQCLQRKHSRIWPWLLHGFASCSFPPFHLVISQNKPVLSNSFALATTVFSAVTFPPGKALLLLFNSQVSVETLPSLLILSWPPRQMSKPFLSGTHCIWYLLLVSQSLYVMDCMCSFYQSLIP